MVFDAVFDLTDEGWRKLTFRWAMFFLALAVLNEIIWRTQTTDFWVNFKVFGIMPLTFVFAACSFRCAEVVRADEGGQRLPRALPSRLARPARWAGCATKFVACSTPEAERHRRREAERHQQPRAGNRRKPHLHLAVSPRGT